MNKIITVLLIVLGVLLVLGFTSLNLEGGNVILYLISVFVIGFFAGGFSASFNAAFSFTTAVMFFSFASVNISSSSGLCHYIYTKDNDTGESSSVHYTTRLSHANLAQITF